MPQITPYLWFDDRIEDAVHFYVSVFKDGEIVSASRVGGGLESQCGWLKDRFGLSWHAIPEALGRYLGDPDRKKGQRAMQAMLQTKKIDIATLDKAHRGEL